MDHLVQNMDKELGDCPPIPVSSLSDQDFPAADLTCDSVTVDCPPPPSDLLHRSSPPPEPSICSFSSLTANYPPISSEGKEIFDGSDFKRTSTVGSSQLPLPSDRTSIRVDSRGSSHRHRAIATAINNNRSLSAIDLSITENENQRMEFARKKIHKSGPLRLKFLEGNRDGLPATDYWCVFDGATFSFYRSLVDERPAGFFYHADIASTLTDSKQQSASLSAHHFFVDGRLPTGEIFQLQLSSDSLIEISDWIYFLSPGHPTLKKQRSGTSVSHAIMSQCILKQGWLKKQRNVAKDWRRRYVVLKQGVLYYYKSLDNYFSNKAFGCINTITCTVKPLHDSENPCRFEIITPQKRFFFEAQNSEDFDQWINAIQNSVLWSIGQKDEKVRSTRAISSKSDKKPTDSQKTVALVCADCGEQNPQWISINLCVHICIACSGIHRSLGVHISKVRSLQLDAITDTTKSLLKSIANDANKVWEAKITDTKDLSLFGGRSRFIVEKYKEKRFLAEEPLICHLKLNSTSMDFQDANTLSILLQEAISQDNENTILFALDLIARGADPNYQLPADPTQGPFFSDEAYDRASQGFTALHIATEKRDPNLVEFLLLNGAKTNISNYHGVTPLDLVNECQENGPTIDCIRNSFKKYTTRECPTDTSRSKSCNEQQETTSADKEIFKMKTGWLVKQGGCNATKGWNKRWFVFKPASQLKDSTFKYYKSVHHREPSGIIFANDILDVKPAPTDVVVSSSQVSGIWPFVFEIHTWSRIYLIGAHTHDEYLSWTHLIETLIIALSKPKLQSSPILNHIPAPKHVFGTDLVALAARRQGSRERGIPLFVSKCTSAFFQLLESIRTDKSFSNLAVISDHVKLSGSTDDMVLLARIRAKFDEDEEAVDLHKELILWENSIDIPSSQARQKFLKVVNSLLMDYFLQLPKPLIPEEILRVYLDGTRFRSDVNASSASVRRIARHCLEQMTLENRKTLEKLMDHLRVCYEVAGPSSSTVSHLTALWMEPICKETLSEFSDEEQPLLLILFQLLINSHL